MRCQRYHGERLVKPGFDRVERQVYRCTRCGRRQTARSSSAFAGSRFPDEIIALAVRWSRCFRLSSVDLVDLLAERGIVVDPSTLFYWIQHFTPLSQEAARPHHHRVGCRWSVDETSSRMAGMWVDADRAIDKDGHVIDGSVRTKRDTAAATAVLTGAVERTGVRPETVTTDRASTSPPAVDAGLPEANHSTGKREQHGIERDHQHRTGRRSGRRGVHQVPCAHVVCHGHAVLRHLADGFSRLGLPLGAPRPPRPPRVVRAWEQLTAHLAASEARRTHAPRTRPSFCNAGGSQHYPTAPSTSLVVSLTHHS